MSTTSYRPSGTGRALLFRGQGVTLRALPALLLVLAVAGCATLAPGADPIVVRTEQTLQISAAIYDSGMTWCEGHVPSLSPAALKLVNDIRVAFPPAYRATDSALQLYKAGKGGDVLGQMAELDRLARELMTLVKLAGGPDLTGGAK